MKMKMAAMLLAAAAFTGVVAEAKKIPQRIVCVTGKEAERPDEYYGAERAAKEFGKAESGGLILHEAADDAWKESSVSFSLRIAKYAEDSSVKAIIVSPARLGTVDGFLKAKAVRNDILCVAVNPVEDSLAAESVADLVLGANEAARGYFLASMAKNAGLGTFVFATAKSSLEFERVGLLRAAAEAACGDLGIRFALENLPEPAKGIAVGAHSAAEAVPQWLAKYGMNTLVFNAEERYSAAIISSMLENGGYYYEGASASVAGGFAEALGIDAAAEAGDPQKLLKRVEQAVLAKGGAKRFGTWASSLGYAATAAAVDFTRLVAEGKAKFSGLADLTKAFARYSPGFPWSIAYSTDPGTGVRSANRVLVYQDTYIFGIGVFASTTMRVDPKYYRLGPPQE
jgi:hypothetical protein